ncbi:hypothetical protein FHX74_003781 [Friedmanniella endophytica]|uniref:Activator of Hsp90 ATPase homologue 1/2-like C-terminal domain-containing protein n=1 Tax=Microlunatus kandeliicorticis TaxID=1759536 RepID=A0A7W3P7M6_9ACTN|nr:SRPBCC family protein [Microlunatus kandeliicorticis]MBA8796140.1 hypothetical protein [Microlunatus kandeliicorticis]
MSTDQQPGHLDASSPDDTLDDTPAADAVVREVVVACSVDHAFEVFTAGIDRWWIRRHHLLDGELAEIGIEPEVDGRVWERSQSGAECTFGRVLAWQPPTVFAFSWQIGPDWAPPAPDAPGSRVSVRFTAVPGGTRVRLVHDQLAAHGEGWDTLYGAVGADGGWAALLRQFAATC